MFYCFSCLQNIFRSRTEQIQPTIPCTIKVSASLAPFLIWHRPANSESLKGQIDQHKFAVGRKIHLFCCNLKEILEQYPKSGCCKIFFNCESSRGPHAEFLQVVYCAGLIFNTIRYRSWGLKTDNTLCCITKLEIPQCPYQFEGSGDYKGGGLGGPWLTQRFGWPPTWPRQFFS